MNESTKSFILIVILSLIWGGSWTALKVSVALTSPLFVAVASVFPSILFFIPFCWKLNVRFLIRKHLWKYVLLGLFSTALVHGFEFQAFRFISSSEAAVAFFIFPLVSVPLSAIFLKEKMPLLKILGVLVGFFGIFFISLPKLSLSGGFNTELLGIGLAMLGGSFWAVASVYFKKTTWGTSGDNTHLISMLQLFFGGVFLLPLFILTDDVSQFSFSSDLIISLIFLIVFVKFIGYFIWYKLLDKSSVVNLSTSTYLIPVFATIFGVFLLGEVFTLYNLFGIMFVLVGIYMTIRKT